MTTTTTNNVDWDKSTLDVMFYAPWLARVILEIPGQERPGCGLVGTDGKYVYYDPKVINLWTQEELIGVRIHEALHILLGHHLRQPSHCSKFRWNIACDFALNPLIIDAGFQLPKDVCLDKQYYGMSAEQIEKLLPPSIEKKCAISWGGFEPNQNATPEEVQKWAEMAASTSWGNLPDSIARTLGEILSTPPDWKQILSAFVSRICDDTSQSWSRPHRKLPGSIPGKVSELEGKWLLAVDTSGSMSNDDLSAILGILRPVVGKIDVVFADAAIAKIVEDVDSIDKAFEQAAGGGGTDFRPALQYGAQEEYDAIIYSTDGAGTFGDQVEVPVVWVMTTDCQAPWGQTINIPH